MRGFGYARIHCTTISNQIGEGTAALVHLDCVILYNYRFGNPCSIMPTRQQKKRKQNKKYYNDHNEKRHEKKQIPAVNCLVNKTAAMP